MRPSSIALSRVDVRKKYGPYTFKKNEKILEKPESWFWKAHLTSTNSINTNSFWPIWCEIWVDPPIKGSMNYDQQLLFKSIEGSFKTNNLKTTKMECSPESGHENKSHSSKPSETPMSTHTAAKDVEFWGAHTTFGRNVRFWKESP